MLRTRCQFYMTLARRDEVGGDPSQELLLLHRGTGVRRGWQAVGPEPSSGILTLGGNGISVKEDVFSF